MRAMQCPRQLIVCLRHHTHAFACVSFRAAPACRGVVSRAGCSKCSKSVLARTRCRCAGAIVPAAPTGAVATPLNGSALVSWRCARASATHPVTQYHVVDLSTGAEVTVGPPDCHAVVQGLANGAPVAFAVVAENAVGRSVPSAASAAVTPSPALALVAPLVPVQGACSTADIAGFVDAPATPAHEPDGPPLAPRPPPAEPVSLLSILLISFISVGGALVLASGWYLYATRNAKGWPRSASQVSRPATGALSRASRWSQISRPLSRVLRPASMVSVAVRAMSADPRPGTAAGRLMARSPPGGHSAVQQHRPTSQASLRRPVARRAGGGGPRTVSGAPMGGEDIVRSFSPPGGWEGARGAADSARRGTGAVGAAGARGSKADSALAMLRPARALVCAAHDLVEDARSVGDPARPASAARALPLRAGSRRGAAGCASEVRPGEWVDAGSRRGWDGGGGIGGMHNRMGGGGGGARAVVKDAFREELDLMDAEAVDAQEAADAGSRRQVRWAAVDAVGRGVEKDAFREEEEEELDVYEA